MRDTIIIFGGIVIGLGLLFLSPFMRGRDKNEH